MGTKCPNFFSINSQI